MKKTAKKKTITKSVLKIKDIKHSTSLQSGNSKIIPLGSRVLIKPFTKEELEKKNDFGIILPDSNKKEKSEQGKVIAVGPGEWHDGKIISISVSVGDTVAFSKYGYDDVTVDGEEYYLIKEENILAILK
jgi:chaperonin GroES